jgi:hypothetical protein
MTTSETVFCTFSGSATTWRTVRSATFSGAVGVAAGVAADPSPPLSSTYASPKRNVTMVSTELPPRPAFPGFPPRADPAHGGKERWSADTCAIRSNERAYAINTTIMIAGRAVLAVQRDK